MNQNPTSGSRKSNISNQIGQVPSPISGVNMEDQDYGMLVQKKVRIKLYQEIPEVFEALTTNQIFQLRGQVTRHIADCLVDTVNSDMGDIRLTDATNCEKLGWFVAETLLKVGLNMASQAAAGIVLDSLHEALNTHGSSPFEFSKQMKEVQFSDGSQGNVQTRRAQPWNAINDITFEVFARQVLSDFGDESYSVVESKLSSSVLSRIKDKMSSLFEWRDTSKNGLKCRTSNHDSALERLLMPLEILSCRMTVVEQIINATTFDAMEAATKEARLKNPNHIPTDTEITKAVILIKARLERLNIHGYITYLNDLANTYIPKLSKRKLFKVILAETLVENGVDVLKGKQLLSDPLWLFLAKKNLIAQRKETSLTQTKSHGALSLFNLSGMSKTYTNEKSDEKLWKQVNEAYLHQRLATTSNKKFGPSSSLACFLASELMVTGNAKNEKEIIRDVHQDSSYRSYTQFLDLQEEDVEFLSSKQKTGELKLSIGVASRFYPDNHQE